MKLHLEIVRRNLGRVASTGRVDNCLGLFQVLISDLRKKDSFPGLFQVLIFNPLSTDGLPGLLQVLIWNLKRLVDERVVLAGFRY